MNSPVFVGIDVGSASVRAGIFDATGKRLAFAVRPIDQFHPRALFVEQSSGDIWTHTKTFHDAKYAIYLQLYDDMERCRAAMAAITTLPQR